jgi:hypothetical protein
VQDGGARGPRQAAFGDDEVEVALFQGEVERFLGGRTVDLDAGEFQRQRALDQRAVVGVIVHEEDPDGIGHGPPNLAFLRLVDRSLKVNSSTEGAAFQPRLAPGRLTNHGVFSAAS